MMAMTMTMARCGLAALGLALIASGELGAGQAPPAPEAKSELQALAEQYQAGDARAKDMARERDRLALQAQSAIIGLKDAELQMEKAISAGRYTCGQKGKVLQTTGAAWACVAPTPEGKEVQKK